MRKAVLAAVLAISAFAAGGTAETAEVLCPDYVFCLSAEEPGISGYGAFAAVSDKAGAALSLLRG